MPIEFHHEGDDMGELYEAQEHIYVNADRTKVVDENDPEAAFLLMRKGGKIPFADAERLGLTGATKSSQQLSPESGDAGPEPADDGEPEPGAEAAGPAAPNARPVVRDKAIRGPKE